MKHFNVVCAVILNNKNEILITQRPEYKVNPFEYEFPGGKIEPNETNENALIREIKEELNCSISVEPFFYEDSFTYPDFRVKLFFHLAKIIDGDISLTEHLDYKWVKVTNIKDYPFLESNKNAVIKLGEIIG